MAAPATPQEPAKKTQPAFDFNARIRQVLDAWSTMDVTKPAPFYSKDAGNVFYDRIVGSGFVLNGAGEVSGLTQVVEWGLIKTPIFLTNTLSVGAVSDAAVKWMVDRFPGIGDEHDVIIPLVGECDDSWLNDIAGRHVKEEHVTEALRTASDGPVAEGNVAAARG